MARAKRPMSREETERGVEPLKSVAQYIMESTPSVIVLHYAGSSSSTSTTRFGGIDVGSWRCS